jgi:hypothetical protein
MTMPLLECNEASALWFQQWSAQLSLNMQFSYSLKHCTKKFEDFCTVEMYTVMEKILYCNWGKNLWKFSLKTVQNAPFFRAKLQ